MYERAHGRRRWFFAGFVIVLAGGALLWRVGLFSSSPVDSGAVGVTPLRSLPPVTVLDEAGGSVSLVDLVADRPAMIALWASWCPFCKDEFLKLKAMKEEFGDALTVVAVNRGESADAVAKSGAASELGARVVVVRDVDDALYVAVGGFSMPEMIFVDKDGKITRQWRGPIREEELRRHIEDLITH